MQCSYMQAYVRSPNSAISSGDAIIGGWHPMISPVDNPFSPGTSPNSIGVQVMRDPAYRIDDQTASWSHVLRPSASESPSLVSVLPLVNQDDP